MFGKLLKHEFRATARIIPLAWAAMAVIVGLYLLIEKLNIAWLQGTGFALVILSVVAVNFLTLGVAGIRFYQTGYHREGYLTHTLPVTTGQLLWSKVLVALIWIFCSTLLVLGGLAAVLAPLIQRTPDLQMLVDLLLAWVKQAGTVPVVLGGLLFVLFGSLDSVAQIFTAIALGNLPGNQKHSLGLSVLFYVLINQVLGTLCGTLAMLLPPALRFSTTGVEWSMNVPFMSILALDSGAAEGAFEYGLVGLILQFALSFVMLFVVKKLMDKKLSVK